MNFKYNKTRYRKLCLKALKIATGSSFAIYLALMLNLEYEISAGTIALLTVVTTKWETMKLSVSRLVTMVITILVAWLVFTHFSNEWVAYGLFIFLLVTMSEVLGWGATISVNAVIGAHFLTRLEFDRYFIMNEVMLVLVGTSVAVVLNLFHNNGGTRKELIQNMRYVEGKLQMLLGELAEYLLNETMTGSVWGEICELEDKLKQYIIDACEYQNNTFSSHPSYYIDYFEMRMQQFNVLHNLHYEIKKIRSMPVQAQIVADYMLYVSEYVVEINSPLKQLEQLEKLFDNMKQEPLPESRAEFESRAILYHILMDLEDFLIFKKRFVEGLSEQQREIYWKK